MKQRMLIVLCTTLVLFGSLPEIRLKATLGETGGKPVTISSVFIEGASPGNLQTLIDGSAVPSQIDIKTRWKDGSIKHALVTFVPPVTSAGLTRTLSFSSGVNTDTIPISVSAVLATDFNAKASFTIRDSIFTVSARDLLSAGKFTYWMKGSLATEFVLRGKPKTVDGISTEDVFVQMAVRFYQGVTNARVSFEIENVKKQHKQDVVYDVALSVGNNSSQEVFRQDSVKQFYMTRWRKIYTWGTTPNEFSVNYPLPYLISTGLVPGYDTSLIQTESRIASRTTAWNNSNKGIMGNGLVMADFGTTGARDEIGPLPRWTAEYLLSMDDRMRTICLGHGDLSGSFSIHLRESDSVRTISIWQYPTVTLMAAAAQWSDAKDKLPAATGACTSPFRPDGQHQPDLAYIPYLLSGDYYYLEEMYYWCSWNLLKYNQAYRKYEKGLIAEQSDGVRGFAWVIRTMAEVAALAPDDHFEKVYYDSIVQYNLSYHTERLLGVRPDNELGVWKWQEFSGANYCAPGTTTCVAPFEHDFMLISINQLANFGFTTAEPLRDFLLKGVSGRFRGDNGFNPNCGTEYKLATSSIVDSSGVQVYRPFKTWGEVYVGMGSPSCQLAYLQCGQCYSAVARAALSTYTRANVEKADTAYKFLNGKIPSSTFIDDVTFALVPWPERSIISVENSKISNMESSDIGFTAYPNPANPATRLVLKMKSMRQNIPVNIYSATGRLVAKINMEKCGAVYQTVVSTRDLASGNYIVSFSDKNIQFTKRFTLIK
ncbi:MAG: T9SS type A sorting domain-containing protein [Fibrobacteres bacterium]|nr:T9SS type A sorting domain-containing protein [Fibrobacterota bacterium]